MLGITSREIVAGCGAGDASGTGTTSCPSVAACVSTGGTNGAGSADVSTASWDEATTRACGGSSVLPYLTGLCWRTELLDMPEAPAHRSEAYLARWVYRIVLDFGAREELPDYAAAVVNHGR